MFDYLYSFVYGKQSIPLSEEIQKIQNSIEYIQYFKQYIGNGTWAASFMIQMKNNESAEYVKEIIENAEILQNMEIKTQLQNDKSKNRENLLSILISNDQDFQQNLNPEFKNFINSLMNVEYLDNEYQKIANQVYPLMIKMFEDPEKGLNDSEMVIYSQYFSNTQEKKYISKEDFVQFLEFCKQNQKIDINEEQDPNTLLLTKKDPKSTLYGSGIKSSSSTSKSSSEGSL